MATWEETALRYFESICAKFTDEEFKTLHQEHSSKKFKALKTSRTGERKDSTAESPKCDAAKGYDFPSNGTMCHCEKEIQHHDG